MNNLGPSRLEDVIAGQLYHHHFQPIFRTDSRQLFGYEALLRSKHVQYPQLLFEKAADLDMLFDLDTDSLILAIRHLDERTAFVPENLKFFINVYPSTILSAGFYVLLKEVLDATKLKPQNLVLEINESEIISDLDRLRHAVSRIQNLGIRIALDDIGKGVLPLNEMLKLHPDMLKLDKYYADSLSDSSDKQQVLSRLIPYCEQNGITVTIEGIETEEDLLAAHQLGIPLVQGFLLGRPALLSSFL